MLYSPLGRSGIDVSRVCLGSMTWGMQNNQADADEQIAYALDKGVNFIDTAEMYAVPPSPDTYGKTEEIIGNWLARNKDKRDDLVIATKIAGNGLPWVRDAGDITRQAVVEAVDASLKRLQTEVIDLYQLHWPNRTSPHFGKQWPGKVCFSEADTEQNIAGMLDILEGLNDCIKAGKIRAWCKTCGGSKICTHGHRKHECQSTGLPSVAFSSMSHLTIFHYHNQCHDDTLFWSPISQKNRQQ